MGMRTIRWSNGQWAERIAHAGSEAVRLVPLFQLASCILDYRRLSFLPNTVSQHGASRCAEMRYASRYRGDNFLRLSRVRADAVQGSGALGALGPRVQIRSRAELCFRRRPRGARGAAARVVRSSDIFTHAGGLRWSQVQNLERRGCRSEHGRRGRLEDCQEHWGSISRSVRTVQGRIDALRVRRALSLRDISMVADIKLSILRE